MSSASPRWRITGETPPDPRETVEIRNGYGELVALPQSGPIERPCSACGCSRDDHSRILVAAPCLDCAGCSFYVTVVRPNPTIIRGESELIGARRRRRAGTGSSGPRFRGAGDDTGPR